MFFRKRIRLVIAQTQLSPLLNLASHFCEENKS
jgi:hypothetical protein